jgi:hypothetical protein
MDRRSLLSSLVAGTAALAGCGGRPGIDLGPFGSDDRRTPGDGDAGDAGGGSPSPGGDGGAGSLTRTRETDLPYRGPAGENVGDPRGLRVENDSGRRRFVTVAVTTAAGRDLVVASREVADEDAIRLPGVVARRGTYDVVVETADGARLRRSWRVTDALGDFEARLDRGLTALQSARCAPDCPPLSTGGETPTYDTGEARGTVSLLNRRDDRVPVTLELASAYRTALRYRYAVPPDVRVDVPAVGWGEPEYRATVSVDGEASRERWRRADGQRLFAVLGEGGTRFLCDTHYRDLRVRNETGRAREVSVTVRGDGETALDRTYDVPATATVRRPNAVAPANRYGFDLATADGERASTEWDICPSRGAIEVVLRESGLWVGVRSMR